MHRIVEFCMSIAICHRRNFWQVWGSPASLPEVAGKLCCRNTAVVPAPIENFFISTIGVGQVQKAVANPHFKAHLFQDTRKGVHSLCSINYAPWQWDLGPKRLRSTTASQKWPCHDQVDLRCKAGRWDFLGFASPETGCRRDHGCSSHSAS